MCTDQNGCRSRLHSTFGFAIRTMEAKEQDSANVGTPNCRRSTNERALLHFIQRST